MSLPAVELNFSASVDRTTVGLGEQLQFVVTVEGANIGGLPSPVLPDLADFTNYGSTSSQSTNISFVNGRMSRQQTISFIHVLAPKRVGTLTIGPARLDYRGTTYQTQPVQVTVTKEAQQPPPRPSFPDPFGPAPRRQRQVGLTRLAASVDRSSVYVGEQVTATYTFYTSGQVANLGMKETPGFAGFWTEKLFDAKDLNWRQITYSGQRCNAATVKQVALFPTQSGALTVDRMALEGQLIVPGFFFNEGEPFRAASDPIRITAKPLPEDGRPAGFCGGVGDFAVTASLSKDRSEGGEPLVLEVAVSGKGNVGIIGEPAVTAPAGVKLLPPETRTETRLNDGRVAGTRRFKYPVIPQVDGRHVIPEIGMSFFNPKAGTYYARTTAALTFVATGATGTAQVVGSASGTGMQVVGTDIRHIKPGPTGSGPVGAAWWTWAFYPAGIAALVAGVVAGRHRRRLDADRGYARRTRSSRLVRKRLAEAERLLAAGNEREFHAALSRAIIGYAGDRFNLEAFGMTGEQMRVELEQRGVGGEAVAALLGLVGDCDAARFSPGTMQCTPRDTLERARALLEAL